MNRSFGCVASLLALVLPPVISMAVTLYLERIVGMLVCIVIFPAVYVLSLFITICGLAYFLRTSEGTVKPDKEAAVEDRVGRLERLIGELAQENELLKKAVQKDLLTLPKKKDDSLLNKVSSPKIRKGCVNSWGLPRNTPDHQSKNSTGNDQDRRI